MNTKRLPWTLALASAIVVSLFPGVTRGQCPGSESPTDFCGVNRLIPGIPGEYEVFMDVSTATGNETLCGAPTGKTVWFEVTPIATGPLTVSTCHPYTTYDTVVTVYTAPELCQLTTEVGCNDDTYLSECANGCSSYGSVVTFNATAGTRYVFAVGAYNNNSAGCTLCLGVRVTVPGSADNSWAAAGGGWWETAGNWSLGVAPSRSHSCYLTNANTKTVRLYDGGVPDTVKTVSNLVVSAPLGSTNTFQLEDITSGVNEFRVLKNFTIGTGGNFVMLGSTQYVAEAGGWLANDGRATLNNGLLIVTNGQTVVGARGRGQMTVSNGTFLARDVIVGADTAPMSAAGGGTFTVAGGTNELHTLTVGSETNGTGAVWVTGGRLVVPGFWSAIGANGVGSVTVSNGLCRFGNVAFGTYAGSQGALRVAGGAVELPADWWLGRFTGSTGSVWITGGALSAESYTVVGASGHGSLTISNGTLFSTGMIFVGGLEGGGNGRLTIAGGTVLSGVGNMSDSGLTVGGGVNSTGRVWMTAGTLIVTNAVDTAKIVVGEKAHGEFVQDGGNVLTDRLIATNGPNSVFTFNGGTLTSHSTAVTNGASFVVGDAGRTAALNLAGGAHGFEFGITAGGSTGSTGTVWASNCQLLAGSAIGRLGDYGVGQLVLSNSTTRLGTLQMGWRPNAQGAIELVGGTITVGLWATLGDDNSSSGEILIHTGELLVTNGTLYVGGRFAGGAGRIGLLAGAVRAKAAECGITPGSFGWLALAGGAFHARDSLIVGNFTCDADALIEVTGTGQLLVTNASGTAVLDVRSGRVEQTGGTLKVDRLVITNACARFKHYGGNLLLAVPPDLAPQFDADEDGLLNGWEQDNELDPFSPAGINGAAGDPDGDGQTNLQEQAAGTDPWKSDSVLRVTAVAKEGSNVRVTWTCVTNKSYRVQTNATPAAASFTDLTGSVLAVSTGTTNHLHTGGALLTNLFYRVRVVP